MGVLRDTILVSVATLGVGSAFMEIDSDNETFNKVFPYVGTFLSAGIGYYLLRKYKFIKAAEYQPDQELSDYSLGDLATSSAIEGFEPFKYSVVGNRAEGLETKKEPLEYDDPMESWMEEYDAEGILETKPSINLSWNKIENSKQLARIEGEIRTSMIDNKILFGNYFPIANVDLRKNPDEYIPKYVSDKMRNNELIERKQMLPSEIFLANDYLDLVGTYEIYEHQFYLVKAEIYTLKEKVKSGQSKYRKVDTYLVFVKPPNKPLEVLAGTAFGVFADEFDDSPIDLYPLIPTSRSKATNITQNFIYNVLMKPKLEFDFDETFEISAGEKRLSDYQNQIVALTYKRKVNYIDSNLVGKVSKSVKITNYYYTDEKAETHLLFGIHESPRGYVFIGPSGNEWIHKKYVPNYKEKWWYNEDKSTGQKTYMDALRKGMYSKGLERTLRSRPILALWLKSILLDSKNLSKRRINLFNNDKSGWLKQQYAPLLFEDYFPVLMQSGEVSHDNTQLIELLLVKMLCIELYKPKIDKITENVETIERSNGETLTKRTFREVISQEINMKLWKDIKSKALFVGNESFFIGEVLENFKSQIESTVSTTDWNKPPSKSLTDQRRRAEKARDYYYQKLYQFAKFIEVVEPDYIVSVPSSDYPNLYYPQFKADIGLALDNVSLIKEINNWIQNAPIRLSKNAKGDLSTELTIMAQPLSLLLNGEVLYDIAKKFIKTPIDDLEAIGIPNKLDDKGFVERDVLQSTFDMKSASHSSMKLFSNPQFAYPKNQKFGNGMFRPNSLINPSIGGTGLSERRYASKPYSTYPFTNQGMYASVVVFPAIDSEIAEFYEIEMSDSQTESLDYANYHKALPIFLHEPDYLALLSDLPKEKISSFIKFAHSRRILYVTPMEISDTKNKAVKTLRTIMNRQSRNLNYEELFEKIVQYSNINPSYQEVAEQTQKSKDYYQYLNEMFLEPTDKYGFKHHSARPKGYYRKDYSDYYDTEKEAESNKKPYSVEISRSSNPEKKLMAIFSDKEGNKVKTTHFGQRGASDYTKHGDKERMQRYLERHGGGTTTSTKEDWKDPTTAGSLSRWVLWNKPSLSGSFADYKRRFGLKGSLNVSKSSEGLETKNAESYSPGNYDFKPDFGEKNERFDEILESAQKLSKPKLKRVLGLEKENPLTRRPMIKAASIAYFMKEAKDQFPKEMYIEYYMKNFTKQELCHLNLIKGKAGWNLTELRKLNKRELSDMLIIEEMGIAFKSETFEATEWVGFCPECNKWRTKDMSVKIDSKINTTGWSIPDKLLGKRLCKKSQRFGKIRQSGDTFTGYGSRSFDNSYCGTPLKKVKSKYKAEFEAEIKPYMKELPFPDGGTPTKELGFLDNKGNPIALYIGSNGSNTYEDGILEWWVVGEWKNDNPLRPHQESEVKRFLNEYLKYHGVPEYKIIWRNNDYDPDFPSECFITLNPLPADEEELWKSYWGKSCSHEDLSIKTMEVLNGELLLILDCDKCGKRTSTSASLNQGWDAEFEARDDSWCVNHGWIHTARAGDIIPCTSCNDMICEGCRCGGCGNCMTSDCCECKNAETFEAKSPAQESLDDWNDEKWKTKSGKPSGETGERFLPTKAIEALTDKEYKETSDKKRRDSKKGKQFSDQPKKIAEKTAKYRDAETFDAEGNTQWNKILAMINQYDMNMLEGSDYSYTPEGKHKNELPPFLNKELVDKMLPKDQENIALIMDYCGDGVRSNGTYEGTLFVGSNISKETVVKQLQDWGLDTSNYKKWKNFGYFSSSGISTNPDEPDELKIYQFPIPNTSLCQWSNAYVRDTEYDDDGTAYTTFGQDCIKCGNQRRGTIGGDVSWDKNAETFEAIEGTGSNARFTDQPDPKVYRDTSLRQKARNKLLKGTKGGNAGQWSAIKANLSATEYRNMYENKYGDGKNPYF